MGNSLRFPARLLLRPSQPQVFLSEDWILFGITITGDIQEGVSRTLRGRVLTHAPLAMIQICHLHLVTLQVKPRRKGGRVFDDCTYDFCSELL
jgi:hypothetical protein